MAMRLASVVVGGDATAWAALGFTVDANGVIAFANGAIELELGPPGAIALRVDASDAMPEPVPDAVDGVPVRFGSSVPAADHPNGCFELDHVVIVTPSIEHTSAAIADVLGLAQRRVRETGAVRQAFHRFDERGCIIELVESARSVHAALWGLVVNTFELDRFVELAGRDLVGEPKPAVQAGRRIATVRSAAGLGLPVAVMSPVA